MVQHRELGLSEYYSKFCHDNASGTTKLMGVLQVEGRLSAENVKESLHGMQKLQPMLRVCFGKPEEGADILQVDQVPNHLPMEIISREHDTQWQEIYETDLNTPMASHDSYLWRFKLLYGGDDADAVHELIVQFHHLASDGISVASFFKQLLKGLTVQSADESLPLFPAVEEMIPDSPGWWTFLRKKIMSSFQFFTLKQLNEYETHVPFSQRSTRLLYREIDEKSLSALIEACRKEGTTLTGVITAVLAKSVFKLTHQKNSLKQITYTPVSLRKNCKPQVPEDQIGCFVNFYQTTHILKRVTPVWDIARAYKEQLNNAMTDTTNLSPRTFSKNLFNSLITSTNSGMLKNVFPYGIGVTNIGSVDFSKHPQALQIRQFHFSTNRNMGDWLTLLHTSSVNGRLFLCFCLCDPLVGMDSANKLADDVTAVLNAIANGKEVDHNI